MPSYETFSLDFSHTSDDKWKRELKKIIKKIGFPQSTHVYFVIFIFVIFNKVSVINEMKIQLVLAGKEPQLQLQQALWE